LPGCLPSRSAACTSRRCPWAFGLGFRQAGGARLVSVINYPRRIAAGDRSDPLKEAEVFMSRNKALWAEWVPLPLRLIIGFGFMAHGWAKLSRGPSGFAKLLDQIGAPLPEATAWVSTLVELFGGLAVFVGAFVELVSVPLIVMMLVAMFTVHLKYGFSSINTIGLTQSGPQFGPPGYEVNLLYIAGLISLILGGAGALSIDRLLSRNGEVSERPKEPEEPA
jgi:putative oxidoreductase